MNMASTALTTERVLPRCPKCKKGNVPKPCKNEDCHYFIPEWKKGVTLEPNYFCRGSNGKREKYCAKKSGQNTDHPAQGRCNNHGGMTPVTHGRYSNVVRDSVRVRLAELERETAEQQLDILPEARMIRALAADFVDNYQELVAALLAWNDDEYEEAEEQERKPRPQRIPELREVSGLLVDAAGLVDKVHKQRSMNAIDAATFFRVMAVMGEVVADKVSKHVRSPDLADLIIDEIRTEWRGIKLNAKKAADE